MKRQIGMPLLWLWPHPDLFAAIRLDLRAVAAVVLSVTIGVAALVWAWATRRSFRKQRIDLFRRLDGMDVQIRAERESHRAQLAQRIAEQDRRTADQTAGLQRALAARRHEDVELRAERDRLRNGLESMQKRLGALESFDGKLWDRDVLIDPPLFIPASQRRARLIAFANLKGGVGKTTITANAGMALARRGKNVLLVDLDFQGSLTRLCTNFKQLKELVQRKETVSALFDPANFATSEHLARLIRPVGELPSGACHFIAAFDDLADIELRAEVRWLATWKPDVRFLLRRVFHVPRVMDFYDYILFDCPPRLTTGSINALAASDGVVIPIMLDQQSTYPLTHMIGWLQRLSKVTRASLMGVVANQVRLSGEQLVPSQKSILNQLSDYLTRTGMGPERVFRAVVRNDTASIGAAADAGRIAAADDRGLPLFDELVTNIQEKAVNLRP